MKFSHNLFDAVEINPVVEALNNLPNLVKLTIIVDPLNTVHDKK
jgi:hypothetical protein